MDSNIFIFFNTIEKIPVLFFIFRYNFSYDSMFLKLWNSYFKNNTEKGPSRDFRFFSSWFYSFMIFIQTIKIQYMNT